MKKLGQYVLLVTLLVANLQPIGVVFAEPSYGLASEGTKGNELTSNIDSSTIQSIEKTIAPTETDSRIVSNETVEITDDSKAEASNTMQEVSTFANEIDAWMPDKNLQNSVATELNKPVANITQEDMKNLPITLIVTGQNISSIQGLEYAINLQK